MIPRGFLTLLSGGGLAQLITLLALPVLGRLYDPTAFGQLAAVMAIVSLAAVVVHGRYQMAIPVAKDEKEAEALLVTAILMSLFLALPVVLLIYMIIGKLPDGLSLVGLFAAAVGMTVISALIDIFAYWRSYRGRFKVSAQNAVMRNLSTTVGQIGLAFSQTLGLLFGAIFGAVVAAVLAFRDFFTRDGAQFVRPSIQQISDVARKYYSYPIYGVPQGWLAALSWNAMPLLLLRFGGTALAGQYWIAYRVLVAPISLFNGTYRQATLPALREHSADAGRSLVKKHTVWIAVIGIFPAGVLFFFGETLFAIGLGSVWSTAGLLASWLGIGILGDVIKIPTLCWLQSQHRQRRILIWEVLILFVRYAVAVQFFLQGEVINAVAAFSCFGLLGWSAFCLLHWFYGTARPDKSGGK